MAQTISAVDARRHFGELLNRVLIAHEEITIERAGKKVAKLVEVSASTRKPEGKLDLRKAAGLGSELWIAEDAEKYTQRERNEWD